MTERVMWEGRILPGKNEEYIQRHDEIWPEMVENLKAQGISNYSIFMSGDRVIGYYECDDIHKRDLVRAVNKAQKEWSESMKDIVDFSKKQVFQQVFYME